MPDFSLLPDDDVIQKTIDALGRNNITAYVVDTGIQAKEKLLSLLPQGAEVMTMTSQTLEAIEVLPEINESGQYNSVRQRFEQMDRDKDYLQMQKLGAAPEYAVGSVHAITQEGVVLIASNTGSQLPAYVYGSSHVIWVAGAQKIVRDTQQGIQRIYDYTLPLEDARARKAYGTGSFVSKLLILNREVKKNRLHLILVRQVLGF